MSKKKNKRNLKTSPIPATKKSKSKKSRVKTTAWWKDKVNLYSVIGILILTALIFTPSLSGDFTNWDDDNYVTSNQIIKGLSFDYLKLIFTTPISSNYHPITMLSLAVNYVISGASSSFSYHLVNLLFHLLNIVLVFVLVHKLTKGKWIVAFITALFFGIHPMHVESVAWVSERKDVLYTFFFLPALLTFIKYKETKQVKYYIYTLLLFVLSILSKPAAVVFPVVLLLIDFFQNRPLVNKQTIVEKIPFFGVSLLFGIITIKTQSKSAIAKEELYTIFQKLCFASYSSLSYITKLFVPFDLTVFHPYPVQAGSTSIPLLFQLAPIGIAILLGLTIWSLKKTKVVAFGVAFFFVNIALVLQFLSVGEAMMAERYTYVPHIGLLIIVGYGVYYLLKEKFPNNNGIKYGLTTLGVIYALGLSYQTFEQCKVWKNSEALWTKVISIYPKKVHVAHNNLGNFYQVKSQLDRAIEQYNYALEAKETYYRSYYNRGNAYVIQQKFDLALSDYNNAIKFKPDYGKAFHHRGLAYFNKKQYPQAIKDYTKGVELGITDPQIFYRRALAYNELQDYSKTIADLTTYLSRKNNDASAYNARGAAYLYAGQYDNSIKDFSSAIRLSPKNASYYGNRSQAYGLKGDAANAEKDKAKAASLR